MLVKLTTGLNFINILSTTFTRADPKSIKKTVKLSIFITLSGSMSVKAAHKMLVKLTPGHCVVRNNSNGGPWQNVFCPNTYAYAFCQRGNNVLIINKRSYVDDVTALLGSNQGFCHKAIFLWY